MKRAVAVIAVCLVGMWVPVRSDATLLRVAYVGGGPASAAEDSIALRWLASHQGWKVERFAAARGMAGLGAAEVCWVHFPDSGSYAAFSARPEALEALARYIKGGGNGLFTGFAAFLPHALGLESVRPTVRHDTLQDDWLWDKKGFQSHSGHPILAGLYGGDYVWDAREDHVLPLVGYFGASWPSESTVLAVDKSYVFIHADRKTIVEVRAGTGRAISVGGMIHFSRANNMRRTMQLFLENSILYLAGRNTAGPVTVWEPRAGVPRPMAIRTHPLRTTAERAVRTAAPGGLLLERSKPENAFFDVAGRRALVMGFENGGIDEVWIHPVRVLRDYQAGIVSGDSVVWLQSLPVAIEIRPESFTRRYTVPGGTLTEVIVPALDRAAALLHYHATGPLRLLVRFRVDLRLMWPYDAGALGDLSFGYDEPLQALHVRAGGGRVACLYGADAAPRARLAGQFATVERSASGLAGIPTGAEQVAFAAEYELGSRPRDVLNFCVAGTSEGAKQAEADYRSVLGDPDRVRRELADHYRDLLARSLGLVTPDPEFNRLWPWAIVGTDRFVTRTPGLGTGLTAGFSTVRRGWDGSQAISGRPGYAWYFGRDAAWSAMAVDGYGDFETVRNQLDLYVRFQDHTGKIYHELMTSGVVHFDASDSTPLFVILAGHYVRASGDTALLRRHWPALQRAMDFMYSTDTDRDGLIENTDVGHGWMEPGGALFGVHTEMHLAVLWSQALRAAGFMARLTGNAGAAERYEADAERVRGIVNGDFWNSYAGFYQYGKMMDGSFRPEPTALAAAGGLFGLIDDEKARPMLEQLAGNDFSTDWGVRVIRGSSPLFNPRSYQQGTVWPLMTGWTALAEYTYGHSAQGFTHMMNTMRNKNLWTLGFVQEVMHGAVNQPVGVCPHQCWSETAVIHPAVEGMIGWKPDATTRTAAVSPRFPADWDSVSVSNLAVGASRIALRMQRGPGSTTYVFTLTSGPSVSIALTPEIAAGMNVLGITVDGTRVPNVGAVRRGVLRDPVPLALRGASTVRIQHTGGLAMVPEVPRPAPGDSAAGYRIISAGMAASDFVVTVEGRSGTTHEFSLATFDNPPLLAQGAVLAPSGRRGISRLTVTFDPDRGPVSRKIVVVKVP